MKMTDYNYDIVVLEVIDGDTLRCLVDFGFNLTMKMKLRLYGINAPELKTPEGKLAKGFVVGVVPLGTILLADTFKVDKYGGRWDAIIHLSDTKTLNDLMVETGHAVKRDY